MKKTYLAGFVAVAIVAFGTMTIPKTIAQKQAGKDRSVTVEGATPENPVVYLGKSFDKKSGKFVDGYAIVHYAKNTSKPAKAGSGAACFGFLANGAKWKSVEDWTVDTRNTRGLQGDDILLNMSKDISKWEAAASGINILGQGSLKTASATLGTISDGKNEIEFADIKSSGAIAITYIWGFFGGPTSNRQLVEWDQVYDDVDFDWSLSSSAAAGKMDFENIATHELGHSVGMNDLYTSGCSAQTMYGYANYGEINKRDLEAGDIAGIKSLYN